VKGSLRAAALVVAVAVAGCGPSGEDVERDRVLRAIDALRDASAQASEARRLLLEELEHQPAVGAKAVRARDTCASAYRHMLDADATTLDIRRAIEAGEAERPDLPQKLADAEANLTQAKELMPACERALVELRRPLLHAR
jgi:hypothetical protein